MDNSKTKKKNKPLEIVASVVSSVILACALLVALVTILSSGKGYVDFFGYAYMKVATGSMDGGGAKSNGVYHDATEENDYIPSFAAESAIVVRVLSEDEKADLKVGQVITFLDAKIAKQLKVSGNVKLPNTHRIVEIIEDSERYGGGKVYITQGDANSMPDNEVRYQSDIIGVVVDTQSAFANALIWLQSQTGFFVCVVTPSLIMLVYCLISFIITVVKFNQGKVELAKVDAKEEARRELLREMGIDPDTVGHIGTGSAQTEAKSQDDATPQNDANNANSENTQSAEQTNKSDAADKK